MKNFKYFMVLALFWPLLTGQSCNQEDKGQEEESSNVEQVPFGDPFIVLHDDTYYAYGTSAEDGIAVYASGDLKTWEGPVGATEGLALHKSDSWGDRWFWAPEVYEVDGTFYMYFSADEHTCVATSDSPLGPFTQEEKEPMLPGEKSIDNSLFIDDDGTPYMYFDRFNDGLNIWVAELTEDLLEIKTETLESCIHVSQEWEEVWPRVNEGPYVLKHEGLYYMTYSANSYESPFYGVGFAVSGSPLGPWEKYEDNPILQKPGSLVGVGHSAMFADKAGDLRVVFHAHNSKENIHPRHMYISDVHFEERQDGPDVMSIDEDFMTPELKTVE
ncbi:MAG: glycoside hydrolase family 43 protein [Bacteroidota bacterium]